MSHGGIHLRIFNTPWMEQCLSWILKVSILPLTPSTWGIYFLHLLFTMRTTSPTLLIPLEWSSNINQFYVSCMNLTLCIPESLATSLDIGLQRLWDLPCCARPSTELCVSPALWAQLGSAWLPPLGLLPCWERWMFHSAFRLFLLPATATSQLLHNSSFLTDWKIF